MSEQILHINHLFEGNAEIKAEINAGINAEIKISEKQKKIILMLKENLYCTIKEISDKLEVNHSTVERNIKKLRENGIVERVGARKDGKWIVKI